MSKMYGRRNLAAILAIVTMGAALSVSIRTAAAGDDVTAGQILQALSPEQREQFETEYKEMLRAAYPEQVFIGGAQGGGSADRGTLLPFRRIFVVAHKQS